MLLFDHPLSPYAQKVRIMLREKGLAFEARLPDGLGSGVDTGYSSQNPRLEVPSLIVGNTALFDSTIILEYLEDAYPEPAMRPADPLERARCREIEDVCDTLYEANNWGLGEIRFFGRGGDASDTMKAAAARETESLQSWLVSHIQPSGWLTGTEFGWADLSAIPYVTMSQIFGLPPHPGSPLQAWVERAMGRPAVAETIAEATEAVAGMAHYSGLLDAGGFRRQFRDHRLEWMLRTGGIDVVTDGLARDNVRFTDITLFRR